MTARDIESLHEINSTKNKAHRHAVRSSNGKAESDVHFTVKIKKTLLYCMVLYCTACKVKLVHFLSNQYLFTFPILSFSEIKKITPVFLEQLLAFSKNSNGLLLYQN